MAIAQNIALEKGHSYIGTEHIFLALLDERSPMIEQMLRTAIPDPQGLRNSCFEEFNKPQKQQAIYADLDFQEAAKMLQNLADILKHIKR